MYVFFFFSNILLIYTCLVFSLSISFIYANLSFLTTIHGINCSFLHSLLWYFLTVFVALTFLFFSLSQYFMACLFLTLSFIFFYSLSCTLAFSISYPVFLSLSLFLFASQSYLYSLSCIMCHLSLLWSLSQCLLPHLLLTLYLSHSICLPAFSSPSFEVFAALFFTLYLSHYLLLCLFFTLSCCICI